MALCQTLIVIGVLLGTYGPGWTRGGKEYVLVSLGSHGGAIKPFDISVTTPSVNLTSASVTTSWDLTSSENISVSATQGHLLSYGMDGVLQGSSARGKAVHIQTPDEIDVSVISRFTYSDGVYLGLPVESLGQVCFILTPDDCSDNCHIAFAATEDNTTVSLTPGEITTNWEHVPGMTSRNQTFTFQLDKHESFKVSSASDISGTRVSSDKPVAVFSGSAGLRGDNHESVVEQLPSTDHWGRTVYTIPTPNQRSKYNIYKVIASDGNTTVSVGGQVADLPYPGSFATATLPSDAFLKITSNKPLLVMKIVPRNTSVVQGQDECMSLVLSMNQYILDTSFFSHNDYNNYVSIVINVTHKDELLLDQTPLPDTTNWTVSDDLEMALGVLLVGSGSHTLATDAPGVRFAAYLHGVSINTNATVCMPLGVALSVSRWPSDCTCSTLCFDEDTVNRTITPEYIANLTEEIRQNLTVERKRLSASIRKKQGARDSRPSAQGMGTISVLCIIVLIASVVLFDITGMFIGPTYAFSKKRMRSNLRKKIKKQEEDTDLVSKLQTITHHQ
ncbi:uncharacterized protein LOC124285297 [Haliotis rubra]|uniref:uncharacterized protein LOC124285297 n=1 Tax=Haliotis rubra TaxID=36100 RepID=UPI001EE53D32|nr:uncharacterized protein LOC124285297 [Haliotis rubra]